MKDVICHFLLHIPRSDSEPLPLTRLTLKDMPETAEMLIGCAWMLHLWGMVEFDPVQQTIRAKSQTAKYALNSLAASLQADIPLIENWKTRGVQDDPFHNGASFLYAIEQRRLAAAIPATPSRRERVAQVLICRRRPQQEQELLFQYDPRARQYQLIGGRWSPRDGDSHDLHRTMVREIEEELPANTLVYGRDYKLDLVTSDLKPPPSLSPTFGALTEYHFHIYYLHDLSQPLILGNDDCWVPVSQIRDGGVLNEQGERIAFARLDLYQAIEDAIPGGFDALADSVRPIA
jgi:hypothetical protein